MLLMDKIRVLIADDQEDARKWAKAILVSPADGCDYQDIPADLVDELFEISTFSIAGVAIKAVKDGWIPDIAMVDIDFQNVTSDEVKDKSLNYKEEATNLRGFDLFQSLHETSASTDTIFFTARGDDEKIKQELRNRGLKRPFSDYIPRLSKGYDMVEPSETIADRLRNFALAVIDQLTVEQATLILTKLRNGITDELLDTVITFGNRSMKVRYLMAGYCTYSLEKGLGYDNALTMLKEQLNGLGPAAFSNINLRGKWKAAWVGDALAAFYASQEYKEMMGDIYKVAANYAINTTRKSNGREINMGDNTSPFYADISISTTPKSYGQSPWTEGFMHLLKRRLICITLSETAPRSIWKLGHNAPHDSVIDYCRENENGATTLEALRQHLNITLGLGSYNKSQRIKTKEEDILPHEWLFISEFKIADKIEAKIKANDLTNFSSEDFLKDL
jgi:CheY-like chemotaxis protein